MPRLQLGDDDDRRLGAHGTTGETVEHLGAGVARVPRAGRAASRTQRAAAEGGAEAGASTAVWAADVIILCVMAGRSGF